MPEFLQLLPPQDALQRLFDHLPARPPQDEWVASASALGRTLSQPVLAPEPSPAFPRSTVDGYAVRATDTFGASESLPAYLVLLGEIPMGKPANLSIQTGQAALIHTGGMLPAGADAVIMLEHTQVSRPGEIEILKAVAWGENILAQGEDVSTGQEVIPAGKILRPAEIGGLMALGIQSVSVAQKPVVALISTGDEVIPPSQHPQPGQVRDINTYTLATLVEKAGGLPKPMGIISDQPFELESALKSALQFADVVIITAGSSASTRDLTAQAIQSAGAPGVLVHGVNIKPGKPTILGLCGNTPVIGLPGNPVSALVIAWRFVVPLIHRLLNRRAEIPPTLQARLTANAPSIAGREDWYPVRLQSSNAGWQAEPIFFKSNLIFSLVQADGLLQIPPPATGLSAGEWVTIHLME